IRLLRGDILTLRKFLYIMEHRSPVVSRRFSTSIDNYVHNDKASIREYIKKRGFEGPREVWRETLRLVLEAEDTADGIGYDMLKDKMYDDDYGMFRHALNNYHICICEPADPDGEFIITESGFSVFEGHIILNDKLDSETTGIKAYVEYHKIATMSPRLAIILRSNLFREGNELRKSMIYRIHRPSLLEDMPVDGATVEYENLKMPDGSTRLTTSFADFEFSMMDSYSMKIYKIPKQHVLILNKTQIEHAKIGLTFCSDKSMVASL